jgi:putative transposase
MPYEYRKLTLEEQQTVVESRRQRGFPLHSPPHPFREAGSYLITAANYEHAPIMSAPERRMEFQVILLRHFHEINAEIVGWVILPNHYHVLISVESLDLVSNVVQYVHGVTSRQWNLQDDLTGRRKVWYRFADRVMRNESHLNQTLNYIHLNPLKHKLVTDIYAWPWSSLFMYVDEKGTEWLTEQWKKYLPAEDFGKGWDE